MPDNPMICPGCGAILRVAQALCDGCVSACEERRKVQSAVAVHPADALLQARRKEVILMETRDRAVARLSQADQALSEVNAELKGSKPGRRFSQLHLRRQEAIALKAAALEEMTRLKTEIRWANLEVQTAHARASQEAR